MKKTYIIITLLLLSACVENNNTLKRIQRMERDIQAIRDIQAENSAEISNLRSDFNAVTGRLDEVTHSQSQALGGDIGNIKRELSSLKLRVPPPAIVPVRELEEDEGFSRNLDGDNAILFQGALSDLRLGDFISATSRLKDLIDMNRTQAQYQDLQARSIFWLAVSFEGLGQFKEALLSYNEVTSTFAKHSRVPSALLRQASALIKLGDFKVAKLTLQKIIATYKNTEIARLAQAKLKDMK